MSAAGEPLDPAVAELLSALLDGAVTDAERAEATAWIERSPEARAEYESLRQVKAVLGGLGEVEPPFGFYDRMLRQGTPNPEVTSAVHRRRGAARWLVAGAAAVTAAAAALVVVGGAAPQRELRPGIEAVAAAEPGAGVRTVAGDQGEIRVLRQEADEVLWHELPDGLRLDDGDTEIWQDLTTADGEERVVVFRDGVVVTVFAPSVEDAEAAVDELVGEALDVVDEEPATDDDADGGGIVDRFRRGVDKLVDFVTPG